MNILYSEEPISKILEYANLQSLILLSREAFPMILLLFSIPLPPRCLTMRALDLKNPLLADQFMEALVLSEPPHLALQLLRCHPFLPEMPLLKQAIQKALTIWMDDLHKEVEVVEARLVSTVVEEVEASIKVATQAIVVAEEEAAAEAISPEDPLPILRKNP